MAESEERINHWVDSHTLYLKILACSMQMNMHALVVSLFRTLLTQ